MTRTAKREASDHEFVTLLELHDPVTAEMAVDLLRQASVPVAVTGLHHNSLLGAVGSVIRIVVRVPARDRARAEDLLAALHDTDAELVDDPETPPELWVQGDSDRVRAQPMPGPGGPYRGGPDVAGTPERSAGRAAMLALFPTFGSGHAYAGAGGRGLALAVAETLALVLAASGVAEAALAVPAVIGLDLVGAVRAVRRERRATRPSRVAARDR